MSGESLQQIMDNGLGDDQEIENQEDLQNEQQEDQIEDQQEETQLSPEQEKAIGDGWTDKEEWEKRGNDPDDWVSAKKFNERGSMIGQIKSLQSRADRQQDEFDRRLSSLNALHDAQQKQTISDLESKRSLAIEDADVEAVNRIQSQIDEVKSVGAKSETEPEANENGKPAAMVEWEKNNAWINDRSPKASYAKDSWNHYVAQGMTDTSEILKAIDADVAKEFPQRNPNRENAPVHESNRSRPGKRQERGLQWTDLTREELNLYNGMSSSFKDKNDFLQAVTDSRKS